MQNEVYELAKALFIECWKPATGFNNSRIIDDCFSAANEFCERKPKVSAKKKKPSPKSETE